MSAMDQLCVQKYGGTSLASLEHIQKAAMRIRSYYEKKHSLVVVVSAMGKTTDQLISMAEQINPNPNEREGREMDMLLTTGEQISIALLAMALHSLSVPAVSFSGHQVGILTNGHFMDARIKKIDTQKIKDSLSQGKVCVVAGFQGVDEKKNLITLGRGGSDTSAVALAAALGSDRCEIFTDVEGVYTADPNLVPNARKITQVSYDEMLELASLGAGVLHPRAVEFGKKYGVTIHVRSSFSETEGTMVVSETKMMEQLLVTGVSLKKDAIRVSVTGVPDRPGIAAEIFGRLARADVNVDMIVQSTGENQLNTISFTVPKSSARATQESINQQIREWNEGTLSIDREIAILSVVGVGMKSHAGVAARMFETLAQSQINIEMISTSEIKISCVINEKKADTALKLIHEALIEFM